MKNDLTSKRGIIERFVAICEAVANSRVVIGIMFLAANLSFILFLVTFGVVVIEYWLPLVQTETSDFKVFFIQWGPTFQFLAGIILHLAAIVRLFRRLRRNERNS